MRLQNHVVRRGISFAAISALTLGSVLLLHPAAMAQRHGGGSSNVGGLNGSISGSNRPTGVEEGDTLKDFHEAMAVQATSQQVAKFQALLKNTEAAKTELQDLLQNLGKENAAPQSDLHATDLDQALDTARSGTKKFQEGFSTAQKSGLKEVLRRLEKADSDLDQEQKKLDQSLTAKVPGADIASHAASLDKAISDFYDEQVALGREMSITLATGQDLTFTLPQVKSALNIEDQTIAVTVSGTLSQTAVQTNQRTFKLELVEDLSDLQHDITELLRTQLDGWDTCGQRVAIRQATLVPSTPASLLTVRLHFERWTCTRLFGQQSANELAEGDGTVEIKLTAALESPNTLKVTAAFGRIDAVGMMGDALRSGSLGEQLRSAATQTVLSALRAAANFKATLPAAVQSLATIQAAKFQALGAGDLSVVLDGQMEISNEQSHLLARQLNQSLAAQGTPPQ